MIYQKLFVNVHRTRGSDGWPFRPYWNGINWHVPDTRDILSLRTFCGELADEAETVLYRENTIVLDVHNYKDIVGDVFEEGHDEIFEPSDRKKARIKSVQVKLHTGCYSWDDHRTSVQDAWRNPTLDSREERLEHIHDSAIEAFLAWYWDDFLEQVSDLSLSCLELDLEDITCPIGCCRLASEIARGLNFSKTQLPKKITINRTLNEEEERTMIHIMEYQVSNLHIEDESGARYRGQS